MKKDKLLLPNWGRGDLKFNLLRLNELLVGSLDEKSLLLKSNKYEDLTLEFKKCELEILLISLLNFSKNIIYYKTTQSIRPVILNFRASICVITPFVVSKNIKEVPIDLDASFSALIDM